MLSLPSLTMPQGSTEQQLQALSDYVVLLKKELEFVLENLDEENINPNYKQPAATAAASQMVMLQNDVDALNMNLSSPINQITPDGVRVGAGKFAAFDHSGQRAIWFDHGLKIAPAGYFSGNFANMKITNGLIEEVYP